MGGPHDMSASAARPSEWTLFPRFVLRRAGFAFDRLDGLALHDAAAPMDAAIQAASAVQAALGDWNRRVFPQLLGRLRATPSALDKKVLERATRAVRRGVRPADGDAVRVAELDAAAGAWLDGFKRCLDRADAAQQQFMRLFEAEFADCRAALQALSQSHDFREAVLLLDGPALQGAGPADAVKPRNSTVRQREQLLFKYAQRFCAKNETNSFFGPVHYGDTAAAERPLTIAADWNRQAPERTAFFSHWAIDEISAQISADARLADILPVMSVPTRRKESGPQWPETGACTRALATAWGVGLVQAQERVQAELAKGNWVRCIKVAPNEVHAALALLARLDALPAETDTERAAVAHWRSAVQFLIDGNRRFAQATDLADKAATRAGLEAQFQALGGGSVKRSPGRMFRSRSLVYEDAWVDAPLTLSDAAADELRLSLAPILDIALMYSRLCRARLGADCLAVARAWFGSIGAVAYDRFIAAWFEQQRRARALDAELVQRGEALQAKVAAFDDLWTQTIGTAEQGRVSQWPLAVFAELCHGMPEEPWAVVSPDLLPLQEADGRLSWVLGEIHHGVTMDGWMLSFAPDAAACKAGIDHRIQVDGVKAGAGRRYLPANLVMARQMKTAPQLYPGLKVELSARASGWQGPQGPIPHDDCAIKDLLLRLDGPQGPELVRAADGMPVRFYPPAFGFDAAGYAPFELCSLPILRLPRRTGTGHAPICSYRDIVVARAEWRMEAAMFCSVGGDTALARALLSLNAWRLEQGMPRHMFLKSTTEPKPVYIDWLSPHAIEFLLQLGRRGGLCTLSEMLPAPQHLWLRGEQVRYTSECRFMMTMVAA